MRNERVAASNAKRVTPEFALFVAESKLNDRPLQAMLYHLLPEGAQRFLVKVVPRLQIPEYQEAVSKRKALSESYQS